MAGVKRKVGGEKGKSAGKRIWPLKKPPWYIESSLSTMMPMFHKKMLSSSSSIWKLGMPFLGSVRSLYCRCKIAAADLELMFKNVLERFVILHKGGKGGTTNSVGASVLGFDEAEKLGLGTVFTKDDDSKKMSNVWFV